MLNTTFSVIFKHLGSLQFDDIFQNSIFEPKLVGTPSKKRCNIRDWKSYAVREPNIAKQLEKCIALLYAFPIERSAMVNGQRSSNVATKFCMHLYLRFSTTFALVLPTFLILSWNRRNVFHFSDTSTLFNPFSSLFAYEAGGSGGWMTWQLETRVDAKFWVFACTRLACPIFKSMPCLRSTYTKNPNSNFQRKFISM